MNFAADRSAGFAGGDSGFDVSARDQAKHGTRRRRTGKNEGVGRAVRRREYV
jgi:hypothetical protein